MSKIPGISNGYDFLIVLGISVLIFNGYFYKSKKIKLGDFILYLIYDSVVAGILTLLVLGFYFSKAFPLGPPLVN